MPELGRGCRFLVVQRRLVEALEEAQSGSSEGDLSKGRSTSCGCWEAYGNPREEPDLAYFATQNGIPSLLGRALHCVGVVEMQSWELLAAREWAGDLGLDNCMSSPEAFNFDGVIHRRHPTT